MLDREKVIQGMERCIFPGECSPDDCPYYEKPDNVSGLCWDRLMADALALLKKQEVKTATDIQLSKDGFIFGGCPKCKALITHADHKNYCGYCGQAVKWYG